jgi:hypothetical protein
VDKKFLKNQKISNFLEKEKINKTREQKARKGSPKGTILAEK